LLEEEDMGQSESLDEENLLEPENTKITDKIKQNENEGISKNLRQTITEYLETEKASNLNQIIHNFNEDIMAKIVWQGEFGLNYLGIDFLKTLLKNLETMNLSSQLELLQLLKTIKFNISLVPDYFYSQIDVFISEVIKYTNKNLIKSNKNLPKLLELLKIQVSLDYSLRPSMEILESWIFNISDQELKHWSWGSLNFLSSILRKRNLRSLLRYQFTYKEKLFDIVEKKLELEENANLQTLCRVFHIFLDFSTAYRLFSKKAKSINKLVDKILAQQEDFTITSGIYLFKGFLLMNFIYKEKELIMKLENSAKNWDYRETKLQTLMQLCHNIKQIRNEDFKDIKRKLGMELNQIIFLRLRFHANDKNMNYVIWNYFKMFPLDNENLNYYKFFYEKLVFVGINRGNYIYILQTMRIYADCSFKYSELLLKSLKFFVKEIEGISLQHKVRVIKLISDDFLAKNKEFEYFGETLIEDFKLRIATVSYAKLLFLLVQETFLGANLYSKNSKTLRQILVLRLNEIWRKIPQTSGFLLAMSKFDFPKEPYIEKFIDSKLNERITMQFFAKFLSEFTTMGSSTKVQLTLLKKILRRCEISVIRKNKETLFGLLGELNLMTIYENLGEKNHDLIEITQILNNMEILDDKYSDQNWRIFKTFIVFLLFNEFPRNAALLVLFKYYKDKLSIFMETEEIEPKFKYFVELCSVLSLASHGIEKTNKDTEISNLLKDTLQQFSQIFYSFLHENIRICFQNKIVQIYMFNSLLTMLILMRQFELEKGQENADLWKFLLDEVFL